MIIHGSLFSSSEITARRAYTLSRQMFYFRNILRYGLETVMADNEYNASAIFARDALLAMVDDEEPSELG